MPPLTDPGRPRSFLLKAGTAAALVATADLLFFDHEVGTTLGVFVLLWSAAAIRPAMLRDHRARLALTAAVLFGLVLADRPSLLAFLLFGLSLGTAVVLPRAGPIGDVGRWAFRLLEQGLGAAFGPLRDALRVRRLPRAGLPRFLAMVGLLAAPVGGGAVFLALFASANPLISEALGAIDWPSLSALHPGRIVFWGVVLTAVWATLRPGRLRLRRLLGPGRAVPAPSLPAASLKLSLLVFNALFAVQNGLDLAFLWSGAPLPPGVTLAEYAHRGAYTLIVTALLAGGFVLVALRPGSETARRPWAIGLVSLWVAQNILLVASSMLRLADYVEAYGLTGLRIAALLWMGLVAVGLVLILWRLLRGRSAAWLMNANALAAGVVLALCAVADLGAVAAAWNVEPASRPGAARAELDLCYLGALGDSAVVSLTRLELSAADPQLRERAAWVRSRSAEDLKRRQSEWRGWSWRGARRLAASDRLLSAAPKVTISPGPRRCDGRLRPPPRAALTPEGYAR